MRIPGFTAEGSLAETKGCHRWGGHHGRSDGVIDRVRPAGLGDIIEMCIPVPVSACHTVDGFTFCLTRYVCLLHPPFKPLP
jgi:hypothetical protein